MAVVVADTHAAVWYLLNAKSLSANAQRAMDEAVALGGGLFELRHVGKLNTRILWFFMKNRRIIAVLGIRNKGQAIPARELDTARERMRDWRERS